MRFVLVYGLEREWFRPDYNELLGRSNQRRVYGITVLLLQFGIPAVISTICYTMISRVMDRQVQRRRCHALLAENEQKLVSRKNRANRFDLLEEGQDSSFQDDDSDGCWFHPGLDPTEPH